MFENFYKIDFVLLIVILVLVFSGLIMIYSASSFKAQKSFQDSHFYLKKHFFRLIMGLALMILAMHIDYHFIQKIAPYIFLFALVLLVYVLINPADSGMTGTRRWMRMGGMNFQPSEFAKYALVIFLSVFLSRKESVLDNFTQGLLPAIIFISVIIVPVLLEPNLGTAFLIMLIATALLIIAGAKIKHIALLGLSALGMITIFVRNIGYQKARLLMFLDQVRGIEKPVWQVKQSLISLGNGGLTGVGLGNSKQKLHFLPQPFTDFIYSILGEELGFLGALLVAMLFMVFFLRTIRIAVKAPDRAGMFLAIGIGLSVMIYFLFNAGVASNLLPITGIPMPFFSYGGSSLVMNLFAVGILLNISSQRKETGVISHRGFSRL
jgi:cell division protein FtsW